MRARALLKLTSIKNAELVYIAPTMPMTEKLMWVPFKRTLEIYGLVDEFKLTESKPFRARCRRTGAEMEFHGLDDQSEVDKLRGRPFDEVYPDEASLYPAKRLTDFLDRAITPRLHERHGCIVMGGTPGHFLSGPFYDHTRPGATMRDPDDPEAPAIPLHRPYRERDQPEFIDWDGWSSHAWTLKDVISLPDAESRFPALVNLWAGALRTKRLKRWSDNNPIWLREYMGIWAADDTGMVFRYRPHKDGALWNQWDPFNSEQPIVGVQGLTIAVARLKTLHAEFKDWRYVVSGDSGSSDPWACNVFAFSPQDSERRLWHVMTFEQTGLYPKLFAHLCVGAEAADALAAGRPAPKHTGILGVTGWPDGMVLDGDQTTIDELANVYGLRFTKSDRNPLSKMGGIELVNGDLLEGRIKVIRGSLLEQQLQQLQWAEDTHGNVKENKAQANHSTDTLIGARKLVGVLFESGAVREDTKPTIPDRAMQRRDEHFQDPDLVERGEYDRLLATAEFGEGSYYP